MKIKSTFIYSYKHSGVISIIIIKQLKHKFVSEFSSSFPQEEILAASTLATGVQTRNEYFFT